MALRTDISLIDPLIDRLPFHLNDMVSANNIFQRWMQYDKAEDKNIIELWTYCYIWRNLAVKFVRNAGVNPADFDLLVSEVFERVLERRSSIRDQSRYTNWVSVICRNCFVNYLRKLQKNLSIEELKAPIEKNEIPIFEGDAIIVYDAIQSAIFRLPQYLQQIVIMRLIEHRSYEYISNFQGKKVGVIRSYFNKAMKKLREDPVLRRLVDDEYYENTKK